MNRSDKWVRTKSDELALDEGCTFNLKAADYVRRFFSSFLRHSKGLDWGGKPFELLDRQWTGIIAPLFGWKRPDGTRRFRRAGIWVPKKQGKSTLCAGLTIYCTVGDGEPGAECYCAALDRAQSAIVFDQSADMIEASPDLAARIQVVRSQKRFVHPPTQSWAKALSMDAPRKEGLNAHLVIFDELHAHTKRDLWDSLVYAGAARRQPLFITISTAGFDRDSIGWEQYSRAKAIIAGTEVDTSFLPYVAEAEETDDWKSPAIWRKANPSYGITVHEDEMAEACKAAIASPAEENSFRRRRLNQWTEQDVRFLSLEKWDACDGPVDLGTLAGKECFAGLDLSSTLDTTALVLLFPDGAGSYAVVPFIWVPEHACKERERTNRTRFDVWIRQGFMFRTDGNAVDYDLIRAKINELSKIYRFRDIAYDPWNGMQLGIQLAGDGFEMVEFRQGFASMSEPTKELEKLILEKRLRHGGHPVLRWMARNVAVEMDAAGNLKPSKKKSTEKIDGIVALIMAIGRATRTPPPFKSRYEANDIRTLGGPLEPEPAPAVLVGDNLPVDAGPSPWDRLWEDDDDE